MEDQKHTQVMNYIRDLGVELLRSLERGTQATLSLRDSKQVELSTETNDLLKTLIKAEKKDYTDSFKENTKALKDIAKAQSDGTKAVISAIKEAKPTIPPFPKEITATVDFKGIIAVAKDILTAVKDSPKKLISVIESIGSKKKPLYVVQVDEDGKVLTPQEAQTVIRGGGVVRTVTLANKAGVEINPATNEKLDEVITAINEGGAGSGASVVGLKDSADARIDPATEQSVIDVYNQLVSLGGGSTLADINNVMQSVESLLSQFQFDVDGKLIVSGSGGSSSGAIDNVSVQIQKILMFLQRNTTVDPTTGQLRVLIGNASIAVTGTLTGVTTVSTVTTLNQIAGFDAKQTLLYAQDRSAWALNVRARIV